ncbi:alpha/beta fold hydrolase, partial [Dietzia massiliensis]|uniref:alpha/beta fold hydrolase n=1 Tax=Dietzia massiliensis TaxID=2697499 RepID=UPI001F1D8F13
TQTIDIPHLGGSTIGYRFGREYDPSLPTLVMINSFTTSVELYRPQFASDELSSRMNLLAIEPYGHGATRSRYRHFTYWDSAIAALQVLQALDIDMAFALGTSQGGWIVTRMALLDPDAVRGLIVVGTSMDYESQASMERGCWDGSGFCTPAIDALAAPAPPRSTCATATAWKPGSATWCVPSCGSRAPPTACTPWPTPRSASPGSPAPPPPNSRSSRAASTSSPPRTPRPPTRPP